MRPRIVLALAALLVLPALGSAQEPSSARESKTSHDNGMEMSEIIERVAKRTGRKFIIDPRVRQTVQLAGVEPGQLSYEQLLAVLAVHQFVAVAEGDWIVVVPDANSRQLPTPVYSDRNFKALGDELVTLTVKPKNVCAAMLVPVLRPLMPQPAHLAAEVQTNTLIINDRAANARRIANLLEQIDQGAAGNKPDCGMPQSSG
jgi:general secretion pathway protein D